MLKKIIISGLFLALVAVLVGGAINRTIDKSEGTANGGARDGVAEGTGRGQGGGRGNKVSQVNVEASRGQGQEGQGNGGRQNQVNQERGFPNYQEAPAEWLLYEGTVSQVPADGVDLIITTAEGDIVVGTGPLDLNELGFVLQPGEPLQVYGYWDDEEFKAGELTLIESDMAITLRDEMGRPSWSGSSGKRRSGNGNSASIEQEGAGQAEVAEWLSLNGIVISVDDSALVVELGDGQVISVKSRPWWFARESGFSAEIGDEISLVGFYEGETFEVGQINNLSSGIMVQIRQESGRPLWAGGGRGSSQPLG